MINDNENKYVLMDNKKTVSLAKSYQYLYSRPRLHIMLLFLSGLILFTFPILLTLNYLKSNITQNDFGNDFFTFLPMYLVIILTMLYIAILFGLKIYQLFISIR